MVKVRSKTVEPVIGTLVNFTNMKRVNTRGIKKNINAYIPNFGQYKSEREGFMFHKEENYYQCTKPDIVTGKQIGRAHV